MDLKFFRPLGAGLDLVPEFLGATKVELSFIVDVYIYVYKYRHAHMYIYLYIHICRYSYMYIYI